MYGITNSSQIIDIDTIQKGCEGIKKAAENFESCGNKVFDASEECNIKVLSVDGKSMQPVLESLSEEIKGFEEQVDSFADSIYALACKIKSEQESELKQYLYQLEQQNKEQ